ncbi:MAG: aminomethyl-transferring glycine dehydrogenase subunit GcvPA [bacterium]
MHNFLPHTKETRQEMLNEIGLNSIEDLFINIPAKAKINNLNIPEGLSELEAKKRLQELANKNKTAQNCISFLGGGTYNRYIPSCINTITQRSEFITAYTPYQPEVSQGTLQVIYDYQSMLCNLTGMDVANASVYDGATACAEAILMASRITKKTKALVSYVLNPDYKKVIRTYCYGAGIEIEYLSISEGHSEISDEINLDDYACVLIQNPNYLGCTENLVKISEKTINSKAKLIICADIVSLAILNNPSKYNADIVVGDLQQLGLGMNYGGPHCGFIACKNEYLRQIPGRIVGLSKDRDGSDAFTLTIQTREQHIKREKAASNICSNQALMALTATIYLSVTGPEGLKEIANISVQRAHYLAEKLNEIKGIKVLYSDFLNEFAIKVESVSADELIKKLEAENILAGINLGNKFKEFEDCILVAITEMNEVQDLDKFISVLKEIL